MSTPWAVDPGIDAIREEELRQTRALFDRAMKRAVAEFRRNGEVEMYVVAEFKSRDQILPMLEPPPRITPNEAKDMWLAAVRAYLGGEVTGSRAERCALVSEVWTAMVRPDQKRADLPACLADAPGREESILVTAEDQWGNVISGSRQIIREPEVKLAKLELADNAITMKGRMFRLLRPRGEDPEI